MRRRRIIVNNDYFNIFQVRPPVTDDDILGAVDRMVAPAVPRSGVDALFLLVDDGLGAGVVAPELARLYAHPDVDPCLESLAALKRAGKDPWAMIAARARQRGIDLFASVRM